mmetsp:Transcript_11250/g.27500  ORF Transcript_11250/g.27500 Transcript_11250/m.27500 type:complete len:201 (-) Transcript_11250:1215-1817(-)
MFPPPEDICGICVCCCCPARLGMLAPLKLFAIDMDRLSFPVFSSVGDIGLAAGSIPGTGTLMLPPNPPAPRPPAPLAPPRNGMTPGPALEAPLEEESFCLPPTSLFPAAASLSSMLSQDLRSPRNFLWTIPSFFNSFIQSFITFISIRITRCSSCLVTCSSLPAAEYTAMPNAILFTKSPRLYKAFIASSRSIFSSSPPR